MRKFSESIVFNYDAILIRINPTDFYVQQNCISIPLNGLEGMLKVYELMKK